MLRNLYQKLLPYARWINIFIGFGLIIFINVVAFPFFGNKLKNIEPNAMGPLDLKFSYSPKEAYQVIESYGEAGRDIAVLSTIAIDVPYPIIYTLTSIFMLMILFKKAFPNKPQIHRWALLPLVTFFADIFENTGIVWMIKNFPERMDSVANMTSFFSSVKWSFVGVTTTLILFLVFKMLLGNNQCLKDKE